MIGSESGRKWVMWGLIGCWPLGDASGDWQSGHSVWSACIFRIIPGNRDSRLYRALGKRTPAKLAYCNTNTMGMKQTVEVLISEITMCQSPEEKEQHNKREIESISEEALISILIVKRISIVRYFTACQNPLGEIIFFCHVCSRVSKLRNFTQLGATCDSASKEQKKKKRLSSLGGGELVDPGPRGRKSHAVSSLWPRRDPVFLSSPRRCDPAVTPGCLLGALWLRTRGGGGGNRGATPAVGMHSDAGRLHSASTVPLLPASLRDPLAKTKEKLFPCCLATTGKPSSGSEGERRGRERAEERKNRLSQGFFFVVIYLIKLKDYSALSQSFSFALTLVNFLPLPEIVLFF